MTTHRTPTQARRDEVAKQLHAILAPLCDAWREGTPTPELLKLSASNLQRLAGVPEEIGPDASGWHVSNTLRRLWSALATCAAALEQSAVWQGTCLHWDVPGELRRESERCSDEAASFIRLWNRPAWEAAESERRTKEVLASPVPVELVERVMR